MKRRKIFLVSAFIVSVIVLLSGCWNYTEIEKLAIVSGMAIDKVDNKYLVTFEIVEIKGGKDTQINTKHISTEGISIFEAARRAIKITGKKLYFSHAEIVILNQKAAEDGLVPVIDWIGRDTEPRYTLHILVSRENTAKEILSQKPADDEILSYELDEMLDSERSLACSIDIEEWKVMDEMSDRGISVILPTIDLKKVNNQSIPEISGGAIFKKDKLVGFLDEVDTKTLMFIRDKIHGGLLTKIENKDGVKTSISLEIYKNKTVVKPKLINGELIMEINTNTDVAIGEVGGTEDFMDEAGRLKLKKDFEAQLENDIKGLVEKVQRQYDSDIFGFGRIVKTKMPGLWKQVGMNWEEQLKNLKVEVHSTINIKNSGLESKPKKVGD